MYLKVVSSEKIGGSGVTSALGYLVWGCGDGRSYNLWWGRILNRDANKKI